MIQRHYSSQRGVPHTDAHLGFDLRTAFSDGGKSKKGVKRQPQWLEAAFKAFTEKNSNLSMGVGAIFPYRTCPIVAKADILDYVVETWLACKPLLDIMGNNRS